MSRRAALVTAATILTIAVLGWFVWPTRWTYDRVQYGQYRQVVVRINRMTGAAEALIPGQGWTRWTPAPNPFDAIGRP